ncbi:hypothetical protein [Mucilaginibacter aquaedulcis]|uniref:hypothetical protein n=1 Tax=Mucilaginibacter aquaedulcis TaxID=1187081 RepID=UPI0025B38F17|nr:hypothetical protein [Mucilaginibacter aquaedulcis]MDN3549225.1 hypothetical protein [Mucilaginibacter aquaedulcis]
MILLLKHHYLRNLTCIFLILLIGCKVILPVCINFKTVTKVLSILPETDDGEKKAETPSQLEKEKEFVGIPAAVSANHIGYTIIIHLTAYHNNYQSSYFLKFTSPPPDFYLQPTV